MHMRTILKKSSLFLILAMATMPAHGMFARLSQITTARFTHALKKPTSRVAVATAAGLGLATMGAQRVNAQGNTHAPQVTVPKEQNWDDTIIRFPLHINENHQIPVLATPSVALTLNAIRNGSDSNNALVISTDFARCIRRAYNGESGDGEWKRSNWSASCKHYFHKVLGGSENSFNEMAKTLVAFKQNNNMSHTYCTGVQTHTYPVHNPDTTTVLLAIGNTTNGEYYNSRLQERLSNTLKAELEKTSLFGTTKKADKA